MGALAVGGKRAPISKGLGYSRRPSPCSLFCPKIGGRTLGEGAQTDPKGIVQMRKRRNKHSHTQG